MANRPSFVRHSISAPAKDQHGTMKALHTLFDNKVGSTNSAPAKHVAITVSHGTATTNVATVAKSLLNDPLATAKMAGAKQGGGGKNAGKNKGLSPVIKSQVRYSKSTAGRYCNICKSPEPLLKDSFIMHIMGKRHRIAEYKQKFTKEQKESRDARTLHVTGFTNKILPEEICGRFWEFGMIDIHVSKKHVFVEFADKASAMTALSSKVMSSDGRRLVTAVRTPRNHASDKFSDEPVEIFLSPDIQKLVGFVPNSDGQLKEFIEKLLNDIQLKPHEYDNRQNSKSRIEDFLRCEFPNVSCHIFGSSANNLGFHNADIDLYASLGYDPYATPRVVDGEAAAAKLTYYLAKHLRRQSWISEVEAIPKARVPIIKFMLAGIAVDLSFRNGMPVQNTTLIRLYTHVHPLVRPYMMLVRFWAKMQRLAGGGKPDTLLTNYALTMLMAFVIMKDREILPPLHELRKQNYQKIVVNGWNCGFGEDTKKYSNKRHNCSVIQLVLEFFEYYATLDVAEWVICPLVGYLIQRSDFEKKSKLPKDLIDYVNAPGNLQYDTPFCVQDPFDLTHNVSRGLRKIPLERFQLLCKNSAVVVRRIMKLEQPLVALFQPIELTDDMYDDVRTVPDDTFDGDDVIVLSDAEMDTSQDIIVLEEIKGVIRKHEEIKLNEAPRGLKRSNGEASVAALHSTILPNTLSVPESFICCQTKAESPSIYKMDLSSDMSFQLDMDTGHISKMDFCRSDLAVQKLSLDILQFMFEKVYNAKVIITDISGQTSPKKQKVTGKSNQCFAKLQVTFSHELQDGKLLLHKINSNNGSDQVSPFAFEKKIMQLQLDSIANGDQMYGAAIDPVTLKFFVCHFEENLQAVVLIGNSLNLSVRAKRSMEKFCGAFESLSTVCINKAITFLNNTK